MEPPRRGLRFDATVSLGTIVTMLTLGFGGIWYMGKSDQHLMNIDSRLGEVQSSVNSLRASMDRNVDRLDRRIDSSVERK